MKSLITYLDKSKGFNGGKQFSKLLENGLSLMGMTRQQFADEIGVIPATISRWISGTTQPLLGVQKFVISKIRGNISKSIEF